MLADRLKNGVGRNSAGVSKIRRAENWHGGNNSRVIDEIADAYDIAVDDSFRPQTRPFRFGRGHNLRGAGGGYCDERCNCQENGADHGGTSAHQV